MPVVYHNGMAQRYFVAVPIPENIVTLLNALCVRLTGHASPVRFHHISLVPPFMLRDGMREQQCIDTIRTISLKPFDVYIKKLGTFHQLGRMILVGHVEPNDVLARYAQHIQIALQPYIQIDSTPYTNAVIPPFDAHTTIDYDAKFLDAGLQLDQIEIEKIDWTINSFRMYKEIEKGLWKAV